MHNKYHSLNKKESRYLCKYIYFLSISFLLYITTSTSYQFMSKNSECKEKIKLFSYFTQQLSYLSLVKHQSSWYSIYLFVYLQFFTTFLSCSKLKKRQIKKDFIHLSPRWKFLITLLTFFQMYTYIYLSLSVVYNILHIVSK